MNSWLRRAAWSLALLVTLAPSVLAQGTTSRLVGIVKDSTGLVLPGVTVTLTNEATGVNFTAVTSDAGNFVFEALVSGSYTVKAELAGFKTVTAPGNRVEIGQPTSVSLRMEPGELAETVQVVGAAEVVQTSTSGNLGTVVDQRTIEALPIVGLRGRNPLDLVTTQPGVVSGANTGGGTHVYGARDRAWNYTLDGIDTNETSAGGSNFSPLRANPDSLQEFRVITGNASAEYGRNSGAQVAMVTRSGTNQFRGTGFLFRRDPKLDATEWETNLVCDPATSRTPCKQPFNQTIGGFGIGGPIKRNKTFFYGNLQLLRATIAREVTSTVFTDQARQGIWRYVVGGRNQPAGVAGASVDGNGNVLPGVNVGTYNIAANDPARIGLNPEIQRQLALMPSPNLFTTGDGLNYAGHRFNADETEEQYDAVIRVDHNLGDRHYTFGRVAWGEQNTICDSVNGGLPRYPGGPCIVNTYRSPFNMAASWRWNPSGSVVNEFVFGVNHFFFDFQIPTNDASVPTLLAPTVTNPQTTEFGNKRTLNTYQFVNNLSWVTGAHSFKFGTNIRLGKHTDTRGSVAGQNATPYINFSTAINTVDPATFSIPSDINTTFDRPVLQSNINHLLGRVGQFSQGFVSQGTAYAPGGTLFDIEANYPEIDFFAQDTWRLSPNFTVDFGLRWELKMSAGNPDDLFVSPNQRVAVGEAPSSALSWTTPGLYDSDYNNLAPSAGVVWDPSGEGKSVWRANYRMAFDRINTFVISSSILQSIPGITAAQTNTAYGQAGGRLPGVNLGSLQPTFTPESFLTPPAVSANSMRVMDSEFKTPVTHGWAISYQREVWSRTVVEAAYIGRKANDLFGAYNVNQAEILNNGFVDAFNIVKAGGQSPLMNRLLAPDTRLLPGETGSDMVRRLFPANLTTDSVAALANSLGTRIQSGQTLSQLSGLGPYFFFPYPQFLGGVNVIDSGDWSDYHGLQLKLERRFSNGYYYMFGYTLSRSKDTRSFDPAFTTVSTGNAQSASSTPFNIFDRSLNYARSDFDRTHVFLSNFLVELPFGSGKKWGSDVNAFVNQIIGGWEIAGQFRWTSGRPFTVYSGSNTLSNVVQTPANCNGCEGLGGAYDDQATGLVWFFNPDDRAKFSLPAAGAFSDVGRNAFVGPGFINMNASFVKRFRWASSQSLEFRADVTNLTNTASFGFPTATITSTTFGRIYNSVASSSRKIQLGLKYSF
jgi:hypothetical protein